MSISEWKWTHIAWPESQDKYGYSDKEEINGYSKVVATCTICRLPKLNTSIRAMRPGYKPVCRNCQAQACKSKISSSMQKAWDQPGYRENQSTKQSELTKERWKDDEFRSKVIMGVTKAHQDNPEYTKAAVAAWNTEQATKRRLLATATEECKQKTMAKLTSPEYLELASKRSKDLWKSEDFRKRVTESNVEAWQNDPVRRERHAMALANQPRVSSIQKTLYKLLGDLDVPFLPEGPETAIGHYVFDCLVPQEGGGGLLIECQGEYWHSLPGVAARDRSKFTYVDKYHPEYEVMYLWENEFYAKDRVLDRLKVKLGIEIPVAQFEFKGIQIREIKSAEEVREFLDSYHYIGKGRGGLSFGAYHGDALVGVAVYSSPLRQNTAGQFGVASEDCRELSRFCIHPSYHKKNFASWFISKTIKRVKSDLIVSYADTTAGHNGTIYLAAGFELHHVVDPDYWYVDGEGFVMHKRTLYGRAKKMSMTEREYAEKHGYYKQWGGQKHCFIKRKQ